MLLVKAKKNNIRNKEIIGRTNNTKIPHSGLIFLFLKYIKTGRENNVHVVAINIFQK